MSAPAADVDAIIQAAGRGTRLGRGPKAFVELAGCSLLERAVTTMLTVAPRVVVAVPADCLVRAERLVGCHAVRVIAGGMRRIDTLRALVGASTSAWLVLHDVVHPLVTPELSRRVIDQARRSGAAAATLANVDFLYGSDGALRAGPGEVVAIQKPVAFRRTDIAHGFALADRAALGAPISDASVLEILALAGQVTSFTHGHVLNCKLTTPDDFELAQRLLRPD